MQENDVQKAFCTTREAAVLLGMSVGTVQLWVESGLLQAWKTTGGHRRVLRDSVDRLLHKKSELPQTPAPPAPAPTTPSPLSILVADDDVNLLRLYQLNLSLWPMKPTVMLADNAVTALLAIGENRPDLLITDLRMPEVDGFAMLRVLGKTAAMADTTIVVVSGLDGAEIARRGGIPPGIEILPKPIPFDRLLGIASAVEQRKRNPTLQPERPS